LKSPLPSILLAFATAVLATPASAAAVWQLRFDEVETLAGIGGEASAPDPQAPSRRDLTVLLDASRMLLREGASETLYDFEARRVATSNLESGDVHAASLYADVGFREYELGNRAFLGQMLDQAGVQDHPLDLASVETELSMEGDPPANPEIVAADSGGTVVWTLNGNESVRCRLSSVALPESLQRARTRWLVYGTRIHPKILEDLLRELRVPELLVYSYSSMGTVHEVRLELRSAEPFAGEFPAPPDLASIAPTSDDPIGVLTHEILTSRTPELPTLEEVHLRASAKLDDRKFLDALLAILDQVLSNGETDAELMREITQRGQDDPSLRSFLTAITLVNQDPEKALPTLEGIATENLDNRHVLAIFEANALTGLERPDEAIARFVVALDGNRYLAGVYKDLGDLYYDAYETNVAWDCWDAARKIAPSLEMLDSVRDLEEHLETAYPRFF